LASSQSGLAGEAQESKVSLLPRIKGTLGPKCRQLVLNKYFQSCKFISLLMALFLPDLWVVFDRPNNDDLDILLTLVGVAFIFELLVQSIGMPKTYPNSFFFWMDLIGAAPCF